MRNQSAASTVTLAAAAAAGAAQWRLNDSTTLR